MLWLLISMISVSRMDGAGGENCHCSVPVPPVAAHKVICATLNSPGPQPLGQLPRAPDANARFPGRVFTPRNVHGPGPLHTSFCRTASKVLVSAATVVDTGTAEQFPLAEGSTFNTPEGDCGLSNNI